MQELLDRIKERNFGRNIEFKSYQGNKPEDLNLISKGIEVYSVYCDGKDTRATVYDFNLNREPEDDDELEVDNIITRMIRKMEEYA